jgi:hypothetical protein
MVASGPSGARLRIGSMWMAQLDVSGPTSAMTLRFSANARALRAHFAGLGPPVAALVSSQTWRPTVYGPARQPRFARIIFIACAVCTPWPL